MTLINEQSPSFSFSEITAGRGDEDFLALLNQAFPVPPGHTFFEDFPVWDLRHRLASVSVWGLYEGRSLVASAGLRMCYLKNPGLKSIPVGIIGAVATHSRWRGQGLASKGVFRAVESARSQGAQVVFLWSGETSLYQKLGFELCGTQTRVRLDQLDLPLEKGEFPHFMGWTPQIFNKISEREDGLQLSEVDRGWYSAHQNTSWFYTQSAQSSEVTAYAALGRGIDLNHIVHEWGGDPATLHGLLNSIKKVDPDAELLGSRSQIEKFFPHLLNATAKATDAFQDEPLTLARVLDPVGLSQTLGTDASDSFPLWIWGLDAS